MSKAQPFVMVDGSSYLFRAYHAMPEFRNSNNEPTGAIYGVINMMRSLLDAYDTKNMVVVFDAKGKTFRNDMYKEYKANRAKTPEDLIEQIAPIHDAIKAMGLPILCVPGVEADDVIGTLAEQATKLKMHTVISTGDKDMAQLVNKYVSLINTMTDTAMDEKGVAEKFGVRPDQIIDYLTLIGDTSDNIPGVPKVGPKTAVKWLTEYETVDTVMAKAVEFKGKVGENLRDSLKFLPLSKQLVTIKCDVELDESPETLFRTKPDNDLLRDLFSQFEFNSWLAEAIKNGGIGSSNNSKTASGKSRPKLDDTNYQTILTKNDLSSWIKKILESTLFAFDLETTSLNYMEAKIVGCSFAVEVGEAAYVPVAHNYENAPKQLERDEVLAILKPLLEDPKLKKVGQNLKYDMNVLMNYDIEMQGIEFDSMLESYVLDSTATRHDMDSLSLKYLNYKTIHFEDIAGKGKKQLTFDAIDLQQAAPYAAEDADITLQLHQTLWALIQKQKPLVSVLKDIEMPLIPVLSRMERLGVLIDVNMLHAQSKQLAIRIEALQQEIYAEAGEEFNVASPKQLQVILFEKKGLPIVSKTPKGQPSTAESVLVELANDYPLPKLILEFRSLSKLKSTYTDKLPAEVSPVTGRVHTSYRQAVAATGRLSSSDPNLQNIPVKSEEGRRIRQAFKPANGYTMVAADYSQIELRIMAHISKDQGLLSAFAAGEDIHRATASEVFGIAKEAVNKEHRRKAKAINFGLIYGMSAFGLAKQLDITRTQAQDYINLYFDRYPGVKDYMEQTRETARKNGYVETIFGRRLYLRDIKASNAMRRQYAERTAINAPMQGTAADIIKRAMINVDALIQEQQLDCRMIMQVHDELVFEIVNDKVDSIIKTINHTMTSAANLDVPLIVDIGIGKNWDEAH
ncbi:MAG: DNA polymerase I [Thiohalomonadales bacterium]